MFQPIIRSNIQNVSTMNNGITANLSPTSAVFQPGGGLKLKSEVEDREDLVARWEVPMCDRVHVIEFEHGTTSGKRVVIVDGKEILRREWMFRLVGDEAGFSVGPPEAQHPCILRVDPRSGFTYDYHLLIDHMDVAEFNKKHSKTLLVWLAPETGSRVVLDKPTLDIWVDGMKIEVEGEFTDRGTETKFEVNGKPACIVASSRGDKKKSIHYDLYIDDVKIDEEK